MRTEDDVEALLTSQLEDPRALNQAVAMRAPHWAHSGIIGPAERREVLVGKRYELISRLGSVTAKWCLERRPAGSRAELDGSRLVADRPGGYAVSIELGGFVRVVLLLAVTTALLDRIGPADGTNDRILTLRARLNDPTNTTEELIAALETNTPEAWGQLAAATH